jgi:hypothetical protein
VEDTLCPCCAGVAQARSISRADGAGRRQQGFGQLPCYLLRLQLGALPEWKGPPNGNYAACAGLEKKNEFRNWRQFLKFVLLYAHKQPKQPLQFLE